MTQNLSISSGTLDSLIELTKDSYLVFVYGQSKDQYAVPDYSPENKVQLQTTTNLLNQLQVNTGAVGKVGMAMWTSPVAQNIISKALPSSVVSRVNSSLYDIMADGKINVGEVAEDFIGNVTNIVDNVATDAGFPTPSSLYSALMPNGTGVISKDFLNLFSKNSQKDNEQNKNNKNKQLDESNILKFKIVTKDSENWATDTPNRKTEKGMYLTPVLSNQNITKNFSISIIDNPNKGISMYNMKNRLYQLRDSRESFDVYIYDADVQNISSLTNCVFTSISIDTEGKNSLILDIAITKIPEYTVQIDTNLDKDIKKSAGNGSNNKNPNKTNKAKCADKDTKPQGGAKKYAQRKVYERANKAVKDFQKQKAIYQDINKSEVEKSIAKNEMDKIVKDLTKYLNEDVHKTRGWGDRWTESQIRQCLNSGYDFKDKVK